MTSIHRAARRPPGTAPARPGQLLGALALDLLALAVASAAVVLAGTTGDADLVLLAAFIAAGVVAGQILAWRRTGRTLGAAITGVRHVASTDAAPPGLALAGSWFADVRGARDPVDPVVAAPLAPPSAPARRARAAQPAASPRPSAARALLVVDGRVGGPIDGGVVVGRNPTAADGERPVAIADLGREISKLHLALRVDAAGRVWVEDRHSTNGSTLVRADGVSVRLVPGAAQQLGAGDVVRLGSHTVAVQFVTDVAAVTP